MHDTIIEFAGDDNWMVMDLYRFLHFLNVFYNRLYVLRKHETAKQKIGFAELKKDLDNSLYKIEKGDELTVFEISLQSPLKISFQGSGEVLREVREFYKDIKYRNKQEEQEQAIIIKERVAELQIKESEADTRVLIDQQLRAAGWEADTVDIRFSKGIRPEKGKNKAIAEWPTDKGFADYVLFNGLTAIAVVEAKRKTLDVYSAIDQAKRYSRGFQAHDSCEIAGGPWGKFKVPFVFATNGRIFLRQMETQSGIWFCDVRRLQNLRRPLESWYTPDGLKELNRLDLDEAEKKLDEIGFSFDFPIRYYQRDAIIEVEKAIKKGKQTALLAMATGTGKTKTCIALIYRLLKAQRFRRILFLVPFEQR